MSAVREFRSSDDCGGSFQAVQPLRDPESNWAVNLAKNLEEYLLKICSGEICSEDGSHLSVNFAEAALLLQGSVQVYSRKVEYLYSLVLHALEFLSQKSQLHTNDSPTIRSPENGSHPNLDEVNGSFWIPDDVPVDPKNCLDEGLVKDISLNHFSKPPANLLVFEGDSLETTVDGVLDSYLLATNDTYQDFILLDPCDSTLLGDFLSYNKADKRFNGACTSSLGSKSAKSFHSPSSRRSSRKSLLEKAFVNNFDSSRVNDGNTSDYNVDDDQIGSDSPHNFRGMACNSDIKKRFDSHGSDEGESDEDAWKPLNPHEPGNLKIKAFKKVKIPLMHGDSVRRKPSSTLFPLAKLDGPVDPGLTEMWEKQCRSLGGKESSSSPFYEKIRQALVGKEDPFPGISNRDNEFDILGGDDFDIDDEIHTEDVPLQNEMPEGNVENFASDHDYGDGDSNSQKILEDLCRSHLDALLSSIAETDKQTDLATRVSTWKQNIEHNLKEQESHPPFNVHDYGQRILEKLSVQSNNSMSFTDIVEGQVKHDVGRTFSALLQLVNTGDVELCKGKEGEGESLCFDAENSFTVQLLSERRGGDMILISHKKRTKTEKSHSQKSPKFVVNMGVGGRMRCTPARKRRCTSPSSLAKAVDLNYSGSL